MGNRLSRIVTRTGDDGTTGLADGSRVSKTAPRVEALGTVDELNSHIGLLLAQEVPEAAAHALLRIQHDLFDLGGELSLPGQVMIEARHVEALEADVERFNAELPPLKEFVLPGGGKAAAQCHVARTVARRAERTLWHLRAHEAANPIGVAYLNRLSDLLFVLARLFAREHGGEILWDRKRLSAHSGS